MPIRKYDRKDRKNKPYGAKWTDAGKRKFQFFETEEERDSFIEKMSKKEKAEGNAILSLSAVDAAIMADCLKKLGSSTAVLRAVDEYIQNQQVVEKPLIDARKEYVAEKINQGLDEDYIRQLTGLLPQFTVAFKRNCSEVSSTEASLWLNDLALSPVTIRSHIKRLKAFYNWMIKHGYTQKNIFDLIPLPKVTEKEPEFLTVDQAETLIRTAQEHYPDAVAYFALGLFAGIRSSACSGLDPKKHIRFKQQGILITAENSKNTRRQFIDGHEPNLWKWLEWSKKHAPAGFSLPARKWEQRRTQVREKAGIKMPHNALRHTFCTYHCSLYGDAGKTATLLTHRGNVSILYQHYKGNATRPQAKKFFAIKP